MCDLANSQACLRRASYGMLTTVSVVLMAARVVSVSNSDGSSPVLSANDRSRWCMIGALVDFGTYEIDRIVFLPDGQRNRQWYTIDMVRHWSPRDGREHYYSSKPPLLPTMIAAPYWLLKQVSGWSLGRQPFQIVRTLLLLVNVLPMLLYFVLMARLIERLGMHDWSRMLVMGTATFGTFLSTFSVTLNNHLPAAISVLIASFAAFRLVFDQDKRYRWPALAGFCAAFAAANELPALSFLGLLGLIMLRYAPKATLVAGVPACLSVAVPFFATNYLAHHSFRPPYVHRGDGPLLATLPGDYATTLARREIPKGLADLLATRAVELDEHAEIIPSSLSSRRWILWNPTTQRRFALVTADGELEIRDWDNWYEYEGSYWTPDRKQGVDRGEPSQAVYTFHTVLGHRGLISLTPIWIFSVWGAMIWVVHGDGNRRGLAGLVILLTCICLAFYLSRPLEDRNYGGVACGFRWMFWLIPLWTLTLIPAADVLARSRFGRACGLAALAVSVFSAGVAAQNPWSHSWLWQFFVGPS